MTTRSIPARALFDKKLQPLLARALDVGFDSVEMAELVHSLLELFPHVDPDDLIEAASPTHARVLATAEWADALYKKLAASAAVPPLRPRTSL